MVWRSDFARHAPWALREKDGHCICLFFQQTISRPLLHTDTNTLLMPDWLVSLLHWLAMPEAGLGALLLVSFISATLLPVGSLLLQEECQQTMSLVGTVPHGRHLDRGLQAVMFAHLR